MSHFIHSTFFAVLAGLLTSIYTLVVLRWSLWVAKRRKTLSFYYMVSFFKWVPLLLLMMVWAIQGEISLLMLWLVVFMGCKWLLLLLICKTERAVMNLE